jgi:hypothetical protein
VGRAAARWGWTLADSSAFSWVCEALEERVELDRLETRGTVRLALKAAGLEARSVLPDQMRVVIEKVLPAELSARGIEDSEAICRRLAAAISLLEVEADTDSPDQVFRRLGGA